MDDANIDRRMHVVFSSLIRAGLVLALLILFPAIIRGDGDIEIQLSGSRISESFPAVADFNGDGRKEIVVGGSDGRVYVVDGASYTVIWEKQMTDYLPGYGFTNITAGITIIDLNKDGILEIIVATGDDPNFHSVGAMIVLTYVGGSQKFTLLPGWPRLAFDEQGNSINPSLPDGVPDGFESTPAAGDIDGDGDLEIVVAGRDRRLHAWHHTGHYVAGWPIGRERNLLRGSASSPALADIDKDGLLEIIVGTYSYLIGGCPNPYVFLALNGNGTVVPGFPTVTTQNIASSPAIGDINGDGWLDIVVGTGDYSESCPLIHSVPDGHKIYAWDHNGNLLPGWPRPTHGNMLSSPALGDLDGDGDLEVVIGCGAQYQLANPGCTYLYAWHGDGSNVAGFPMRPQSINSSPYPTFNAQPYSPVLVDYDGDNTVEIMMVGAGSRGISIVEPNGTQNADTRRATAGLLSTTPLVEDIDNDGYLETIIGGANDSGKGVIYIWQETGTIYNRRPWPMFHHDVARTGLYTAPPPPPQLGFPNEVRALHQVGSSETATFYAVVQNLGTGTFDWQAASSTPKIQVIPSSGTLSSSTTIRINIQTNGYAADTWHYIGELNLSASAFGQPVLSSPRTIPVWLYSGDLKTYYFPLMQRHASSP